MATIPPENVTITRTPLPGSGQESIITYQWTVVDANDTLAADSVEDAITNIAALKNATGVTTFVSTDQPSEPIQISGGTTGSKVTVVAFSKGRINRATWAGLDGTGLA